MFLASTSSLRAKKVFLTLLGLVVPVKAVLGYSRLGEGMETLTRVIVTLSICVPGGGEGNCPDHDSPEAFVTLNDQKCIQCVLFFFLEDVELHGTGWWAWGGVGVMLTPPPYFTQSFLRLGTTPEFLRVEESEYCLVKYQGTVSNGYAGWAGLTEVPGTQHQPFPQPHSFLECLARSVFRSNARVSLAWLP